MRIGVPSETKTLEGRVALVPAAAGDLVKRGHEVWIEKDAGVKSGFRDEQYAKLGVHIAPDAAAAVSGADVILSVQRPDAAALAGVKPGAVAIGLSNIFGSYLAGALRNPSPVPFSPTTRP